MFLSVINSIFKKNKYLSTRTFTYYIPAPPARKTGYREKEFDQMLAHILKHDFELIDIKIQSISGESKGLWAICILGCKTPLAQNFDLNIEYASLGEHTQHIDNDIHN